MIKCKVCGKYTAYNDYYTGTIMCFNALCGKLDNDKPNLVIDEDLNICSDTKNYLLDVLSTLNKVIQSTNDEDINWNLSYSENEFTINKTKDKSTTIYIVGSDLDELQKG